MTIFYVNHDGKYLGGWDGSSPPDGSIEVPYPPPDANYTWDGSGWVAPVYPPATEEQAYLEFKAMIYRRADALEASGDILGALFLRESFK